MIWALPSLNLSLPELSLVLKGCQTLESVAVREQMCTALQFTVPCFEPFPQSALERTRTRPYKAWHLSPRHDVFQDINLHILLRRVYSEGCSIELRTVSSLEV